MAGYVTIRQCEWYSLHHMGHVWKGGADDFITKPIFVRLPSDNMTAQACACIIP